MAEAWDSLEEWEEWDPESGTTFFVHAMAGSCAGAAEHCAIFPFDTIKTHMQAEGASSSSIRSLVRQEGMFRLWRGVSTMFTACVPAHAAYFSLFEQSKIYFGANEEGHHPVAAAASGAIATIAHDSIMTPMDVVKQRLQLGFYNGMSDCFWSIVRTEGAGAFFLSFPTTLFMNIPYAGIMVASNESFKKVLNPTNEYNLPVFFISGGMAGAVAAAFTNPLDVVKTRLQTQNMLLQYHGESPPAAPTAKPTHTAGASFAKMLHCSRFNTSASGIMSGGLDTIRRLKQHGQPTFGFAVSPFYSNANKFRPGSGFPVNSKGTTTTAGYRKFFTISRPLTKQNELLGAPMKEARHISSSTAKNPEGVRYYGMYDAVKKIYSEDGLRGFTRGMRARLMVHAPSVAISWTTYETAKNMFMKFS
mmetsp:Transcript_7239/g.11554  ORF Transcript_7239/g.11554 Transcript_7239/m.11554 type:complete len:418 (+) Transcript_7239:427-1680(+)